MGAEPFGRDDSDPVTRAEFRHHLHEILKNNKDIDVSPDAADGEQITPSMDLTRALTLAARKTFYLDHRIRDQRRWYVQKAIANKNASKRWLIAGIAAYGAALVLVLSRIAYPDNWIWPIEPLIVIASAIIGWTQVKKFNELASSYTLTAHEIGIIQSRIRDVQKEADFADFINEAEQAFSREHTQWVARQQTQ